ncbi:MAG: hypothetical protein IKE69_11425 [Thermoguttaceae bacterium]|nr:hypothetical protein [Thermoguttaceae bacterium]
MNKHLSFQLEQFQKDFEYFVNTYFTKNSIGAFQNTLIDLPEKYPIDDEDCREHHLFLWIIRAFCLQASDTLGKEELLNGVKDICELVKQKNERYGNAALSVSYIYAGMLSPADTILIRAEDKIKRYETLKDGGDDGGESIIDTLKDFVGYVILLYIACRYYGYTLHLPKETDDEPEKRPALVLPGPMTFGEIRELVSKGYFDIYYTGDDE